MDTALPLVVARPDPSWDAAAAQDALNQVFSLGLPDPRSIRDLFMTQLNGRDSVCPSGSGASTTSVSGCTSSFDWTYTGTSTYQDAGSSGFSLAADIYIQDPNGNMFEGGGQVFYMAKEQGIGGGLDGTWGYSAAEGWMAQNPSFSLSLYIDPNGMLILQGGLGMAGQAIDFNDFGLRSGCAGPIGSLSLRDPNGWWYNVDFGDTCSGCGPLSWGETNLGEVCLDPAPLMDLAQRLMP